MFGRRCCARDVRCTTAVAPNNEALAYNDDEVTLAASFAVSADQVAKVHLGQLKSLVTFFANQIVVHINCLPLVVAMVAHVDSNAGALCAFLFARARACVRAVQFLCFARSSRHAHGARSRPVEGA